MPALLVSSTKSFLPFPKSETKVKDVQEFSSVIEFPNYSIPDSTEAKDSNAWSHQLSSSVGSNGRKRFKYVLNWDHIIESTEAVVSKVVEHTSPFFVSNDAENLNKRKQDIQSSIEIFQQICDSTLDNIESYEIKVEVMCASFRPKCPAWHTDYVPMRWIQTMTGPGCQYIAPNDAASNTYIQKILKRDYGSEGYSIEWKDKMVEKSGLDIQSPSKPGQPVILVGNKWPVSKKPQLPNLDAVLHRSPRDIGKGQERVLVTLDVITSGEKESTACDKECCANTT